MYDLAQGSTPIKSQYEADPVPEPVYFIEKTTSRGESQYPVPPVESLRALSLSNGRKPMVRGLPLIST